MDSSRTSRVAVAAYSTQAASPLRKAPGTGKHRGHGTTGNSKWDGGFQVLWAGRKPTKRTFAMLSYYFMGLASEKELRDHIEKLKRHDLDQSQKA